MIKHKVGIALVVFGLCVPAAMVPAAGQETIREEQPVVRWKVEFADGTRAKLMGKLGDVNRVTRQDGSVIAFSPIKDKKTGQIRLQVSEVVPGPNKTETFRLLASLPVDRNAPKAVSRVSDFTVEIDASLPPKPPRRAEQTGIPISDRVIRWEIAMSDGKVVRLAAREGELARLKMADGRSFGLLPVVRGDRMERIEFRLYEIHKIQGAGESLKLLESFGLEDNGEYFPSAWGASLIKVFGAVSREAPAAAEKSAVSDPPIELDGCCVTCGGTRACGCAVSMDCGDCCIPPCCDWIY